MRHLTSQASDQAPRCFLADQMCFSKAAGHRLSCVGQQGAWIELQHAVLDNMWLLCPMPEHMGR